MRIVIVGATALGVATARKLIGAGYQVVLVDRDRATLDALGEELDCGMIQGDGSAPSTLRAACADGADALLALTNHDEDNVLSALVGRSIGFKRVLPKMLNKELGAICEELELKDAVFADETVAASLLDSLQADAAPDTELPVGEAMRMLRVVVRPADAGPLSDLDLPENVRLVALDRDGAQRFADEAETAEECDGLILLAHEDALPALRERFGDPTPLSDRGED